MSDAFDPFNAAEDEPEQNSAYKSDKPFRSETRGASFFNEISGQEGGAPEASFDASFDSSAFQFSPSRGLAPLDFPGRMTTGAIQVDEFGANSEKAVTRDVHVSPAPEKKEMPVIISLHEEMSCSYDNLSRTSSCAVEGIISIRPTSDIEGRTFYLALKDPHEHIERLSFDATFVDEAEFTPMQRQEGNRIFGVTVPEYGEDEDEIQMIKYSCSSSLRPVPVLVQTKVRIAGKFCRVGIKIRSNPSNEGNLENVAVLLPVPPDIDGETVKMSRRGGIWDAMKRIIVWTVPELQSGETVEVQSQFEFVSGEKESPLKNAFPRKFPVLVRCDALGDQLSGVNIDISTGDEHSYSLLILELQRSFRVLYRKL